MKALALLGVLAVLAFSGSAVASSNGANDGALSVKNADGRVIVNGRGGVIGRFDKGQVTIKDPNPNDGTGPIVNGADTTQSVGDHTTRYSGSNIRFRIIGGAVPPTPLPPRGGQSRVGRGPLAPRGGAGGGGGGTGEGGTAGALPRF